MFFISSVKTDIDKYDNLHTQYYDQDFIDNGGLDQLYRHCEANKDKEYVEVMDKHTKETKIVCIHKPFRKDRA